MVHRHDAVWQGERAAVAPVRHVNVDLSTAPHVEMAGAEMLDALHDDLAKEGTALHVFAARAGVREMLRLEGLEEMLGHISRHVSPAQAVAEFEGAAGEWRERTGRARGTPATARAFVGFCVTVEGICATGVQRSPGRFRARVAEYDRRTQQTMSVSSAPEQHIVLRGISFETYERMRADLDDRPIRLTFDRGTLEIMTPSHRHEEWKRLLGRMVEELTATLDVPIRSGGSTTWQRRDLDRGLEPDECYWVQNATHVGNRSVDLAVDPPPDLAIEVDVSSSSVDRMSIYAALGVPEIWRCADGQVRIWLVDDHGIHRSSSCSRCFPWLPFHEFSAWLRRRGAFAHETAWIRAFREWLLREVRVE